MNYYIDTEFIEGFHKPLFGKKRHFIDLISIGIVCEDGRKYSAISNEYNYKDADDWVKENVILPLYLDTVHGDARNHCDVCNFHKAFGKSNNQIADEIKTFVFGIYVSNSCLLPYEKETICKPTNFYGYYADYDWVLFCSLFGRMIDLPKGFPMYCSDLKQILEDKAENLSSEQLSKLAYSEKVTHNVYADLDSGVLECPKSDLLKNAIEYPKQENEHLALDDAMWNMKLHNFLKTL